MQSSLNHQVLDHSILRRAGWDTTFNIGFYCESCLWSPVPVLCDEEDHLRMHGYRVKIVKRMETFSSFPVFQLPGSTPTELLLRSCCTKIHHSSYFPAPYWRTVKIASRSWSERISLCFNRRVKPARCLQLSNCHWSIYLTEHISVAMTRTCCQLEASVPVWEQHCLTRIAASCC